MAKYKLTKNKKEVFGVTLFQIEATVSFGSIVKGELGGWIEKEKNLSQDGNAWVYGNAWVSGDARVYGDAWVYGNAQVYGKLKLTLGYFFGWKEKEEDLTFIDLPNDNQLIAKGDIRFETENDKKTELLKKAEGLIAKANEIKAEAEKL